MNDVVQAKKTVKAALVALPETAPAGLYSLLEVFSSVGTVWEELTGKHAGEVRMHVDVVTERAGLQFCGLGVPVQSDATFATASGYDFVMVPDVHVSQGTDPRGQWPAAVVWIRSQYASGSIIASACTGALLLAETGLLDGFEATTHWGVVPLFEALYPQVRLCPEKVLALAGPQQRIVTAGGASSWVELALFLIAFYCGRQEAVRIAKVYLLGDRNEGQLPFAVLTRPRGHSDTVIQTCQQWIAEHFEVVNPVERLTAYSGLNPRTFKRRFHAATGFSPLEYIQILRIEEAKYLLENGDMPTDQVGEEIGYEDPASFRRLFKRLAGVTPARYRRRFQAIGRMPASETLGQFRGRQPAEG